MIHIHIFTMLYICINNNTYRGYQKGGHMISNFVLSYKCMYMYIYETYTYIYNAIYILLLITKQGQRILKGWGKNFKCCSVKRNKKMTLSGSFTNHFFSI